MRGAPPSGMMFCVIEECDLIIWVCIFTGGHSLLIRVCAKKKSAFFIISFSIGHVYRHANLLHWVHVLGRVRMRASFWDSILVYVLGDSMSCLFDFCERGKWPFFRVSGSLLSIHYPIYFRCDYFPCFYVGWPSLTFLSFCLLLSLSYSFFSHPAWCLT